MRGTPPIGFYDPAVGKLRELIASRRRVVHQVGYTEFLRRQGLEVLDRQKLVERNAKLLIGTSPGL
jgi:hypothetical protein